MQKIFDIRQSFRQLQSRISEMGHEPVAVSFQRKLDAEIHIAREGVERWLKDQDLSLSDNQKKKLTYLLVHYLGTDKPVTEDHVLNLLGNLGGGHFDFDDMNSVEIEIQRILGYSQSSEKEKDRKFFRKYLAVALFLFSIFAVSTSFVLYRSLSLSHFMMEEKQKPVTEAQMQALYKLADSIIALRADLGRPPYTRDEIILLVGGPLEIYDSHIINGRQFSALTGLLQTMHTELLKQKQKNP